MTSKPFRMAGVTVVTHPLVAHKLSIMRAKDTSTARFRQLLREISTLLCYEVTRDLPLEDYPVETPVGPTTGQRIAGKKMVFVPILRAGLVPRLRPEGYCPVYVRLDYSQGTPPPASYEEALAELEGLVGAMERTGAKMDNADGYPVAVVGGLSDARKRGGAAGGAKA